jgi:hypothetical protein
VRGTERGGRKTTKGALVAPLWPTGRGKGRGVVSHGTTQREGEGGGGSVAQGTMQERVGGGGDTGAAAVAVRRTSPCSTGERQGRGGADAWARGHCAGFKPGQPSQKTVQTKLNSKFKTPSNFL